MAQPPFPNESVEYREARDRLIEAEAALRQQTEDVAALRRNLPLGGPAKEDYVFDEIDPDGGVRKTKLSELFAPGKESLFLYGFMFGPEMKAACPLCTSMLDGLNGNAVHILQRMNLAVVARSPIQRIQDYAATRGWTNLRLLSSANNTYQSDYFAEDEEGNQWPMANVFVKRRDTVHHFWGSELMFRQYEGGDMRHVGLIWSLWNVLDLTPEGRGEKWYPALDYGSAP
jgi:predicted dithiol-disulfide oxidoreductase (DUF899 family)